MTEGLGFPQFNALIAGICSTICITLMVVLTNDYGNLGIASARLIGFATFFFSIFIVEKWFFKHIQIRFWFSLTTNLVIAAALAAVIEYIVISFLPLMWPTFILSVVLGGATYCFILWLLNFVTADDKLLIQGIFSRSSLT